MKENEIKKATKKNVVELIREGKDFNLQKKNGFLYMVGGILCKTVQDKPYKFNRDTQMWVEL